MDQFWTHGQAAAAANMSLHDFARELYGYEDVARSVTGDQPLAAGHKAQAGSIVARRKAEVSSTAVRAEAVFAPAQAEPLSVVATGAPASAPSSANTEITIFEKRGGILSKKIALGEDGRPHADGSACRMGSGEAWRKAISSAGQLAHLLENMKSNQALTLGRLRADIPDHVAITTKARPDEGAVPRIRKNFEFKAGEPAWMLLDIDRKGMPEALAAKLPDADSIWSELCHAFPELARSAHVVRASTSAGLSSSATGETFPGSGGAHIFVLVEDGSDIPRALGVMVDRLWLNGLGWVLIGGAGQNLIRCLVDGSVGAPERLVFEGAPDVVPPLKQDLAQRAPRAVDGTAIDTRATFADLTSVEQLQLTALREAEFTRHATEAAARRRAFDEKQGREIAAREGVPEEVARRKVALSHKGQLLSPFVLHFDHADVGETTVRQVLADPDRYVGLTMADPLEGPSYGWCKAKLFQRPDGSLVINSFAHGGMTYQLQYDYPDLEARVQSADRAHVVDLTIDVFRRTHLEADEVDKIIGLVAKRTNIGKIALKRRFMDARREHADEHRHPARATSDTGSRHRFPAPPHDGEMGPVMKQLDEVLCASQALEPPMRNLNGRLVQVRPVSIPGLRALSHAAGAAADGAPLPGPKELVIEELNAAQAGMLIEEHIEFTTRQNDVARAVRLPFPFVAAYLDYRGSSLPVVSSVCTAPLISPRDGSPILGEGLDRSTGVFFQIDPELRECVPTGPVGDSEVREAYDFLINEWLVDVATGPEGKATAVLLALTLVQRIALPTRPAFFITAGQRGGGKTTLANMMSVAILGREASAAAWAGDEEERRKAILGFLLSGASMIVWDNIPRGLAISSPAIERVLTSPQYSDRVLGASETVHVPSRTVMIFTGNNIEPKGDMASRALTIALEVDRLDPENRKFQHSDIIGWTFANRARILRALYTILMGNPYLHTPMAERALARTRFKEWYGSVGAAVEHAAGLVGHAIDIKRIFQRIEGVDEEAEAVSSLLQALDRLCMELPFTAREVAEALEPHCPKFATEGENTAHAFLVSEAQALRAALAAVADQQLQGPVSSKRVSRLLKRILGTPARVGGQVMQLVVKEETKDHLVYEIQPVGSEEIS